MPIKGKKLMSPSPSTPMKRFYKKNPDKHVRPYIKGLRNLVMSSVFFLGEISQTLVLEG